MKNLCSNIHIAAAVRRSYRAALLPVLTVALLISALTSGIAGGAGSAGVPSQEQAQTVTGYPIPTSNSGTSNITNGADGNFYFTETTGNKIGQITTNGVITEFPIQRANSQPFGIASGPDGAIWFTEMGTNRIGRLGLDGSITEFVIPTADSHPSGIKSGSDGALWFTENTGNKIGRITTAGVITEFPVPTPNAGLRSITAGPDGNMWFTEQTASKIGRIATAGHLLETAGDLAGTAGEDLLEIDTPTPNSGPNGITLGLDGNVWFTETRVDKLGFVTPGGNIVEIPLFAGSNPTGITWGTDGSIHVDEQIPGKFLRVAPVGGQLNFSEIILPPGSGPSSITFLEQKLSPSAFLRYIAGTDLPGNGIVIDSRPFEFGEIDFSKGSLTGDVQAGNPARYVFTIKNNSPNAFNFVINDVYPTNRLRFKAQTGWNDLGVYSPSVNPNSGLVESGPPATLMPGEQKQVTLDFDTIDAGLCTNRATLSVLNAPQIATSVSNTITPGAQPDFSIAFNQSTVTAAGKKTELLVNINRTGGFTGPVTITPPTELPKGVVVVTDPITSTGSSETFVVKVKEKKAKPGQYPLTFTAKDASGKTRTDTVTFIVPSRAEAGDSAR